MHQLTERLHFQHIELQQALAGIRPRQFRTEEGRDRINRVRTLFHSHIETEHKELYPVLKRAARQDQKLAARLKQMNDDLKIVTDLAEGFFAKYENGQPRLIEFATDHGALVTILKIRLRREEETLFPEYERLSNN